ncbi:uncharacterized protein LOC121397285 [Xenopus laevis]|uniref:Uncharacterized protein LOC121397285 n=1 Tax=Xenopus laevis TaxID=8355 RepID=A0A8J1LM80_XENLA|nr:uncharacterized protein LOC121397285 [Xenopus laevis]
MQEMLAAQSIQLFHLQQHVDDQENRSRRNNIRIKGLPEATGPEDLHPSIQDIFNNLLGRPNGTHLEMDCVHRETRPFNPDAKYPRDVICRIHFYAEKEQIMRKANERREIDFDGAKLKIFSDLSKPSDKGRTAVLKTPMDLEGFLKRLSLPQIALPAWTHPQWNHRGERLEDATTRIFISTMEKSLRNPSLKTLYSVLKNFREEYTDFEALASYYEDHYQDQNSKNLNLKHFLLTCVEDPRMRAKENIAQYILMLDSLEVLKRERASLKNAKLPPGHPTRLQNRRQKYEYLRLENTIKDHFCQFQIELLREQKLREAARKKHTHKQTPAAKEKEDGATAAAEEGALASQGKEERAKEKKEEEEAAPKKEQQEEQQEKMEEQSPAVKEQVGMKRKRNEEEAPAAPPRKRPRKDCRGFR